MTHPISTSDDADYTDDELIEPVAELSRLLWTALEACEISEHFHRRVVAARNFFRRSIRAEHPTLDAIARETACCGLPDERLEAFRMNEVTPLGLWHGTSRGTSGARVLCYYVASAGRGLVEYVPADGQCAAYLRFSLDAVSDRRQERTHRPSSVRIRPSVAPDSAEAILNDLQSGELRANRLRWSELCG